MSDFVYDFREAAPYIHYLRGKTVVIAIASSLLQEQTMASIAADLNLLAALGVRLVLVHDLTHQLEALCSQNQYDIQTHHDRHITDKTLLQFAKQACGQIQLDFQAALSLGFSHAPQRVPRLRVVTGNLIAAKPLGVIDGIDMGYTGVVRKIDLIAVNDYLAHNAIVLLSPIGSSLCGQNYVLTMEDVAQASAIALQAEKLIFLTEWHGIHHQNHQLLKELTTHQAQELIQSNTPYRTILQAAVQALNHHVSRVQILSGSLNGGLLRELFTREGIGTSISQTPFINIRKAQEYDITDIITLIRPLEEQGILLPRSREYLERHLHEFSVLENDCQIYGCVALKTFADSDDAVELACLVVSPQARDGGYGDLLLKSIISQTQALGKTNIFALSTQAGDWFIERGFQAACINDLPQERQAQYHANARQSKIFVLKLNH